MEDDRYMPGHGGSSGGGSKKGCLIGIIVAVVLLLIVGGCVISGYNKAVGLKNDVEGKWAQIESKLKRRFDLIPNLVETVKGYAKHEKELFTHLADVRTSYFAAKTTNEKAAAAGKLEGVLSRLLMLKESYPDLKANKSFINLQYSLEGAENRIDFARTAYNTAVKDLNTYVETFFGRSFASWAGVEKAEYFKVPEVEKAVPKVKF